MTDNNINNSNKQEGKPLFACPKCGSNEILVVNRGDAIRYYVEELKCTCDSAQPYAVRRICQETYYWRQLGELNEHHCVDEMWLDELDGDWDDSFIVDEHRPCEKCAQAAGDDPVFFRTEEFGTYITGVLPLDLHCGGCKRPLEFGWEHPNCRGRTYPVECRDFDPKKLHPDPRFKRRWKKRGWLPPAISENGPEAVDSADSAAEVQE